MIDKNFGPLTSLIGKWVGTGNGWNIIAVPTPGKPDFALEITPYLEQINIKIGARASAPNKGGAVGQQDSFALEYELSVTSKEDGSRLHIENGMWLHLIDPAGTTNPNPIARQAIVPHGNSVLLMGPMAEATTGAPSIGPVDPNPIDKSTGHRVTDLPQYLEAKQNHAEVFGPNFNPNKTLEDALAKQSVKSTLTFQLSTANNGGSVNIPFINEHAKPTLWETVIWIETLEDGTEQMQYTQTIMIEFNGLRWPHIDVNTLTRQ